MYVFICIHLFIIRLIHILGKSYIAPDANGPQKITHQGREFVLPTSHTVATNYRKMKMSTCKYELNNIIKMICTYDLTLFHTHIYIYI